MTVAHWDDIEPLDAEMPPMSGRWRDLGAAAGSVAVGARRIEVADAMQSRRVVLLSGLGVTVPVVEER